MTYDRYGLTGNPFRDLASESLEDVAIFHVNQEVDRTLRTIREEVFDKENRAVVAVIGELGSGKTERLRVTASEAQERQAFVVYFDVPEHTPQALRGLSKEFLGAAQRAGLVKTFGGAGWIRSVQALEKLKDEKYDPISSGKALARALNDSAPAFLLLNDLHNLIASREIDAFAKVLQEVTDSIKPGVLVMFTCYSSYLAWLTVNHPALATRINRTFLLSRLNDDEAALLLAKKLLAKRVVEDLDPTYPFDADSVHALNEAASGNPRRVLELADLCLEYALAHRFYRVEAETVASVVAGRVDSPLAKTPKEPATRPAGAAALGVATRSAGFAETKSR